MNRSGSIGLALVLTAASITTASAQGMAPAAAANTATRIRGEIVSVNADTMVVHRTNADNITVTFKPEVPVAALKKLKLTDIKANDFVGVTSVPGADGKLTAREVHVFPEALRGRGEGHRDWDLVPGSSMTNANVDSVVSANNGRELTMSYKGGSKQIVVPDNTPIVTYIDATHADVVAGKKVFVIATIDGPGKYTANRVTVEKDGVVPPM